MKPHLFLMYVLALFLSTGHSQGKFVPPLFMDDSFSSLPIQYIGMLPTADYRQDRSKPFKQAEYLRKWLCPNLKKKGYPSEFTGNTILTPDVLHLNSVLSYNDSLTTFLGASTSRFVFLPMVVAGTNNNFGVGKKSSASIVGIIFDKEQKKVIWMNEANGKDTGVGAIAALSGALAVDEAIYHLMLGFPKVK